MRIFSVGSKLLGEAFSFVYCDSNSDMWEAARRYKIHGYVSLTFSRFYGIMFSLIRYIAGVTAEISAAMICGRFVVDHIFDHLQLRTTWKQCLQEHPKASFSDTKAPKSPRNQGKNRCRFVWEQDVAGSNPVIPTKKDCNFDTKLQSFFIQTAGLVYHHA